MLKQNGGTFSTTNEYVRIVLALTALGQDAKSFAANGTTYDLVTPLTEKSGSTYKATVPGTTSTAFAHHRARFPPLQRDGQQRGFGYGRGSAGKAACFRRMGY